MLLISQNLLLTNRISSKIINLEVKIHAFSAYHFRVNRVLGNPLPRVSIKNDNGFIIYRMKNIQPKVQISLDWTLFLDVQQRGGEEQINYENIPENLRNLYRRKSSRFASRRLQSAVIRLFNKSNGDIHRFEIELVNFLDRNFTKSDEPLEVTESFFDKKYGSVEDFNFGFRVLNGFMGIPTRGIFGYRLVNKNMLHFVEWYWTQYGNGRFWVDIDPYLGKLVEIGEYIPIVIYDDFFRPPLYKTKFKTVRKILRGGIDLEQRELKIEIR